MFMYVCMYVCLCIFKYAGIGLFMFLIFVLFYVYAAKQTIYTCICVNE